MSQRISWRLRRSEWRMVATGVVALGIWVVTEAIGAHPDDFDPWAGWANILGLPMCALGLAIVIDYCLAQCAEGRPAASGPVELSGARGTQLQNAYASGGTCRSVVDGQYGARASAAPDEASRT